VCARARNAEAKADAKADAGAAADTDTGTDTAAEVAAGRGKFSTIGPCASRKITIDRG